MDTAQAYKNEAHVGQGLRNEGISRSDVFISMDCFFLSLSVNEMNLVTFFSDQNHLKVSRISKYNASSRRIP